MSDIITVTGVVATEVKQTTTAEGLAVGSFRLASTQRRFDRATGAWVDGDTNWYTVQLFRQLAVNTKASVDKGQHVVVTGRFRLREWRAEERTGHTAEIVADAVGHDLGWGTTVLTRVPRGAPSMTDATRDPGIEPESSLATDEVPVPF